MISSWTHKLSTGWNNLSCSFRFSAVIFATAEPLTSSARFEGSKPVARSDYSDFLHCWWFVRQVGFYLVQSVHRSRAFKYSLGNASTNSLRESPQLLFRRFLGSSKRQSNQFMLPPVISLDRISTANWGSYPRFLEEWVDVIVVTPKSLTFRVAQPQNLESHVSI